MSVISQLEDDHFYIKVFTAAVEKDFSKEQMTTRFFTKNTIIVEESEVPYEENFQVFTYYCPPLENKDKSLNVLAEHDCGTLPKKETIRLSYLKKRATNDIFILQFGKLGRMIEAHFRLKEQSKFLFILGPNDPVINSKGVHTYDSLTKLKIDSHWGGVEIVEKWVMGAFVGHTEFFA
ncbi:hypothetical protein V6N13_051182 [Hibiscus sabdariffa]